MKKIVMLTALFGTFGTVHAASFSNTFETAPDAAQPVAVIVSVEKNDNGLEIPETVEARAVAVEDLTASQGISRDVEEVFAAGQPLVATETEVGMEMIAPVAVLVIPNIINTVGVAASSSRRASYSRRDSWHRPDRDYYYYYRCGRYRCSR